MPFFPRRLSELFAKKENIGYNRGGLINEISISTGSRHNSQPTDTRIFTPLLQPTELSEQKTNEVFSI